MSTAFMNTLLTKEGGGSVTFYPSKDCTPEPFERIEVTRLHDTVLNGEGEGGV